MDEIFVHEGRVHAVSPEGKAGSLSIAELCAKLAAHPPDTCGVVLPAGVKAALCRGGVMILVHETPPRLYNFKWIAEDSPARFGPGTKYRLVRLALPYVVVFAVFVPGPGGELMLSDRNECFFRTASLETLDAGSELCFPGLLNCSRFRQPEGHPLSWICTQHLNFAELCRTPDLNQRVRQGLGALLKCLLDTGFNDSSEHHEGASGYSESRRIDDRLATVENWVKASAKDPLFVLEVPWLPTGHTARQLADRIFSNLRVGNHGPATEADLARLIFNQQPRTAKPRFPMP